MKPKANTLRLAVLFIFFLHLFCELLSLSSLSHPHQHQGLVVFIVYQGALQEEGKHRRLALGKERWLLLVLTRSQRKNLNQQVEGGNDSRVRGDRVESINTG